MKWEERSNPSLQASPENAGGIAGEDGLRLGRATVEEFVRGFISR